MRAKINHGQRGTKIETLLKRYDEFKYPSQYFWHIEESYQNGNFDQTIELFNEMKRAQQMTFLLEYAGVEVKDFIIKNL